MRGKRAKKRVIVPDPKYKSVKVSRFINYLMFDGKKTIAEGIVYDSIEGLTKQLKGEGVQLFETALKNVMPPVEIKAKRVGGANYQVPVPVPDYRQEALAMRWLINAARNNRGKRTFAESMTQELV